jgi:hypothetical protein
MSLHRYDVLDAYTLEELRREYTRADAKGRTSLLKELQNRRNGIPFDIARMAVEDEQVEVRECIARHGQLDYSETLYEGDNPDNPIIKFPERNLEEHLKHDPDAFVRACLRENPHVFLGTLRWVSYFQQANHLERLALMRNPEVQWGKELIERIFDHENHELGISLEERQELICAFLTNKEVLADLDETRKCPVFEWPDDYFGLSILGAEKFLTTLWELASKWPKEQQRLRSLVYQYVPAGDETKAKIYQAEEEPGCRCAILQNCTVEDAETLKLALRDTDKYCRSMAEKIERKPKPTDDKLKQKWKEESEDKARQHRDVISFFTILGVTVVVVKLYFPDWSDLALLIGLFILGVRVVSIVFHFIDLKRRERKERWEFAKSIWKRNQWDGLEKARTLLEEGKSPQEVMRETHLSMRELVDEGLLVSHSVPFRIGRVISRYVKIHRP